MNHTIYQDEQRTITRTGSQLVIQGQRGEKTVSLTAEIRSLNAEEVAALRKSDIDPAGWYTLAVPRWTDRKRGIQGGGNALAICPPETRAAVAGALQDYAAEIQAIHNSPCNQERGRIEDLLRQARRVYEQGEWSEYYRLLNDIEAAQKQWAADYPAEAAAERRADSLAQAEREEQKALGALVYDADGSLSRENQEARAEEFRARARALRQAADKEGQP